MTPNNEGYTEEEDIKQMAQFGNNLRGCLIAIVVMVGVIVWFII